MGATTAPRPPEVTVESTISLTEFAAIEGLLSRLDPEPGLCRVPGCLHLHDAGDSKEGVTALAA
jgi:hypothetical protein